MKADWLTRSCAVVSAVSLLLAQMTGDLLAAPTHAPQVPYLDGRPPVVQVAAAAEWRPGGGEDPIVIRFDAPGGARLGLVDGHRVVELAGDLFAEPEATGTVHRLHSLRLLPPLSLGEIGQVWDWETGSAPRRARHREVHHSTSPADVLHRAVVAGALVQRRVVHLPGLRASDGPRVGTTCGLAAEVEGTLHLTLGPGVVVGPVGERSLLDPLLRRGDVILSPSDPSRPARDLPRLDELAAWLRAERESTG